MKVGDIVYFKSVYTARYGKVGGSYEYHFKPDDRYLIEDINTNWVKTGSIRNLEDNTTHFAHSEHWSRIITKEEWRDKKINKLLE
jgi:hypothetical protein